MGRIVLRWLALASAWVAGTVLGTTSAGLRTAVGRRAVVDWVVAAGNARLAGTVAVGEVSGSFFGGLTVRDVVLRGNDGVVLFHTDALGIRYRVRDLLRGRIVFGQLTLHRPEVNLVQWREGAPTNLEALLPTGDDGDRRGPLVAFSDVRIAEGRLVVRTPVDPTDTAAREWETGPHGLLAIRRVDSIAAQLPYVRVASPRSDEQGILVQIRRLAARMSDPQIQVIDAQGRAAVRGDSVLLTLGRIRLPETEGRLTGSLRWSGVGLALSLQADVDPVATDDVRGVVPALPPGLRGRGRITVQSPDERVVRLVGEDLELEGTGQRGSLRGRLGMRLGPADRWGFDRTALQLRDFDLTFVSGLVDTLPVAGRLTGRVEADGPQERLRLVIDARFRDSLVPGWPESRAHADGMVRLGGGGDLVFERLAIHGSTIDLATVDRLVPASVPHGVLRAAGTLDGPWRNATFAGDLHYAAGEDPASAARGSVRIDAQSDPLAVWADLLVDSLRLASFRSSYPPLEVPGAWYGRLQVAGRLDGLTVTARLRGPAGSVDGTALLELLPERRAVRDLDVAYGDLDLREFLPAAPVTRLNGTLDGELSVDDQGRLAFQALLGLASSVARGVPVDSGFALVAGTDRGIRVDSAQLWANELEIGARGGIAFREPSRDTLTFVAATSSVRALEPLTESWLGALELTTTARLPSGAARVAGQLVGSLDAYQVVGDFAAAQLRRGDVYVSRLGGTASWVSATGTLNLEAAGDSLGFGGAGFGALEFRAHGRLDSLGWHGRSRFGDFGAWIGGGQWIRRGRASLALVDSLGILLASGPWFLDTAAVVMIDDSSVTFQNVGFAHARQLGRVSVQGRFPFSGPGELAGSVEALPVEDIALAVFRGHERTQGVLSGTLQLSGTARAPMLRVFVALRDGGFGEFRAPYTESVVQYRDRRLTGEVGLFRMGEEVLRIDVDVPVDLSLAGAPRRRLPGPIRVLARADRVDLSLLEATTPSVREIGGALDADFGITGTWEQPELTGTITIRDGAATLPALGVRHEALNGSFGLAGDTIHIRDVTLRSGRGSARLGGFVRLEELTHPVLNVEITAREFRAVDVRDFLTLAASADLALRGPLYGATLTGAGTATRGVLYFADLITKDIVNLQDTLFAEFVDTALVRRQGLGAAFQSRFLDNLRIDSLRLDMGSEMWLRSSEANIQLAGAVFVSKLRNRYRIDGTLQAPRGTYRLQLALGTTREFTVTRGDVRYFGTPDLNADLNIDARHLVRTVRGEDVTVSVNIGGTLYEPQLTLSSDIRPPISDTEIISYLLFGAPSVQAGAVATGFETRLLSQQIFGALSSQLEYSLIADLGVPLDYLQIRPTTATGEVSGLEVAVGKQFRVWGRPAFLTASPRLCPRQRFLDPENLGASLEFRLSRRWLLAASADPRGSCEALTTPLAGRYQLGFDLFWETSY